MVQQIFQQPKTAAASSTTDQEQKEEEDKEKHQQIFPYVRLSYYKWIFSTYYESTTMENDIMFDRGNAPN